MTPAEKETSESYREKKNFFTQRTGEQNSSRTFEVSMFCASTWFTFFTVACYTVLTSLDSVLNFLFGVFGMLV